MNHLLEIAGKLCEVLLHVDDAVFVGNPCSNIAICTLSSTQLAKHLSEVLINDVCIIGRLLSENKGIDMLLQYLYEHKNIKFLIICGKDVHGHKAGHSLIQLHKFGTDNSNMIINSTSPEPKIISSKQIVEFFQRNISIINEIGESDLVKLQQRVNSLKN